MSRIEYTYTRSGLGPTLVPDREPRFVLPIAWYAPKPAWMTHIPGPRLRFGSRYAFNAYRARTWTARHIELLNEVSRTSEQRFVASAYRGRDYQVAVNAHESALVALEQFLARPSVRP